MKILVVGALRYSNFGDILFAKLFYNRLLQKHDKDDIILYETAINPVSSFCRKELNYKKHFQIRDLKEADALLYISGGYFSNVFENIPTKVLWHLRYAFPGIYFANHNKRIFVVGVGEGDFSWNYSANIVKKILDKATFISVRNQETADRFAQIGVKNKIEVTTDTAQIIRDNYSILDSNSEHIKKTRLFLHIIPNDVYFGKLKSNVFPGIKRFLEINKNLNMIVGYDSEVKEKYLHYISETIEYFKGFNADKYIYTGIEEFIDLLMSCKVVVTPKLHVGIVSASLNNSVFSFPINAEKTKRYYKNIGFPDRCIDIDEVNPSIVFHMLNCYINSPVTLSDDIVRLAKYNLEACDII